MQLSCKVSKKINLKKNNDDENKQASKQTKRSHSEKKPKHPEVNIAYSGASNNLIFHCCRNGELW